jgi:hypothetical protein
MSPWYLDLPGVTGRETLSSQSLASWPDRAMDDRLRHLRVCPVVPSELYQIARHLPVTVVDQADGPMVMVDLRTEVLRQPAFDSDGRLQRSYRPAVTRLLPFCASTQGALLRLSDEAAPPGPERPAELQQQVAQMLRAQAAGLGRLAEAAGLLISEGLLQRPAEGGMVEWRPMSPEQDGATVVANLAPRPESFLALRLLAVMEFSSMHRRDDRERRPGPDSLRGLLSRNEALRRRVFLTRDEMLDFSALTAGSPRNHNA